MAAITDQIKLINYWASKHHSHLISKYDIVLLLLSVIWAILNKDDCEIFEGN